MPVSAQILLVPVVPLPPRPLIEATADRLTAVLFREVAVVDPMVPPSSAGVVDGLIDPGPVHAALGASWGCGCRTRLVGVTAARLLDDSKVERDGCTATLLVHLEEGEIGEVVRAVGRTLGLDACHDQGCAMHPGTDARVLCPGCRSRI